MSNMSNILLKPEEVTYDCFIKTLPERTDIDFNTSNIYNILFEEDELIIYERNCSDGFRGELDFIIVFANIEDLDLFIKLMEIYNFIKYKYIKINNTLVVNFMYIYESIFTFRIARLFTYYDNNLFSSYVKKALKQENPHLYLIYLCWNTRYNIDRYYIYDKYNNFKQEDLENLKYLDDKLNEVVNTPYVDMYPNINYVLIINDLDTVAHRLKNDTYNDNYTYLFYNTIYENNGSYKRHIFTKSMTFKEFLKIHKINENDNQCKLF